MRFHLVRVRDAGSDDDETVAVVVDPGAVSDAQLQRLAVDLAPTGAERVAFLWRPARPTEPWRCRIVETRRAP